MSAVNLSSAGYILHAKNYLETSQILNIFTYSWGLISVIARGVKRKNSKFSGLYHFNEINFSWTTSNKGTNTLIAAEPNHKIQSLQGERLLSAMYLNELIINLLKINDPHENLYLDYQATLGELLTDKPLQISLRKFEKKLLLHIGYEVRFDIDCYEQDIVQNREYYYQVGNGFTQTSSTEYKKYNGKVLLNINNDIYENQITRVSAKEILKISLNYHLNGRDIRTRKVIRDFIYNKKTPAQ